ncbi:unnamed protein product [Lasius platythorax]|uniref:Uncharacterized protein n=1 Tax=Lasius platythorax TaxID=488582 RepID=A0AAV2N166_9HYME
MDKNVWAKNERHSSTFCKMTFPKRDLSESSGGNTETINSTRLFSATNSRRIRGMLRRSALVPQTLRNRKIRYPLSVVEIRDYAVNFLGGMTTH